MDIGKPDSGRKPRGALLRLTLRTVVSLPLVLGASDARAADTGQCGVCHGKERVQFTSGIHFKEDISCTSCHPGDASTDDVGKAHRGKATAPGRKEIPALCGSCHSNIESMKVYNLPTDQLALYHSSQHGRLLAKGNLDAAVCTDCHGVHDIRPPEDPQSSVYVANIPKTCAGCHSDPEFRARYHTGSDPYAEFVQSVHGRELLENGNLKAPECSRCHGVHGATPPGVGDVSKVCGQCHAAARAYFEKSPHREAMSAGGEPECASCHTNHAIQPAGEVLLGSVCGRCHAKDGKDEAGRVAREIDELVTGTRKEIEAAEALVLKAEAIPLNVDDYQSRLQDARSYLTEAIPAVHSFSPAQVRTVADRARSIGAEVDREVREKLDRLRWRRYGLGIFWFYLILTIVILLRYRRRLSEKAARERP